jgi:hypothetical protein
MRTTVLSVICSQLMGAFCTGEELPMGDTRIETDTMGEVQVLALRNVSRARHGSDGVVHGY